MLIKLNYIIILYNIMLILLSGCELPRPRREEGGPASVGMRRPIITTIIIIITIINR